MGPRAKSLLRAASLLAAGALCATLVAVAIAAGLDTSNIRETSTDSGTRIMSVRPTGVGLPLVGATGTTGGGDYASALKNYHDSGDYEADLKAVGTRAGAFLYRHGRAVYNFRGLRAFKDKFDPEWESHYLAYAAGTRLMRRLADVSALIAGGYRRVILP